MMILRVGGICVALLVVSAGGAGLVAQDQIPRVLPVDEGVKDPSFVAFRQTLRAAAQAGDLPKVFSLIPEDVTWREDLASRGVPAFRRYWRVDREPARFVAALTAALEGGRFTPSGEFVGPYVYTEFPLDHADMPLYLVVVSDSAPVYPAADARTKPLMMVSYAVLRSSGIGPDENWYTVLLKDGLLGYLKRADGGRPADARARFRKIDGAWKLVMLAQGID